MLGIQDVAYRYSDGTTVTLPDWHAESGEHWALMGPSGSGKSTLLNILGGLLRPTHGTITVGERHLETLDERALDQFRGRHVGMVFQTLHLVDALNVHDNLLLARYFAGLPQDGNQVQGVLDALGIGDLAKQYPGRLSQGQAQRVALARAVINEPSVILADEPTSALDEANCNQVLEMLVRQARALNAALVIATHDPRVRQHMAHTLDLEAVG